MIYRERKKRIDVINNVKNKERKKREKIKWNIIQARFHQKPNSFSEYSDYTCINSYIKKEGRQKKETDI